MEHPKRRHASFSRTFSQLLLPHTTKQKKAFTLLAAHGLMVIIGVLFGFYNVLIGQELVPSDSLYFPFWRFTFAMPVMLSLTAFTEGRSGFDTLMRHPEQRRRAVAFLCAGGVFGVFANQYFFTLGLMRSNADIASLFQPLIPVFTCAIALPLKLERFHWLKVVGVLVSVGGTVSVMLAQGVDSAGKDPVLAAAFLVANTLGAALLPMSQKPVLGLGLSPLFINAANLTAGWIAAAVGVGINAAMSGDFAEAFPVHRNEWTAVLFGAFVCSSACYSTMAWCCQHLDPSVINLYQMLQPIATTIFSFFMVPGTKFGYNDAISGGLIILGLTITSMTSVSCCNKGGEAPSPREGNPASRRSRSICSSADDESSLLSEVVAGSPGKAADDVERDEEGQRKQERKSTAEQQQVQGFNNSPRGPPLGTMPAPTGLVVGARIGLREPLLVLPAPVGTHQQKQG